VTVAAERHYHERRRGRRRQLFGKISQPARRFAKAILFRVEAMTHQQLKFGIAEIAVSEVILNPRFLSSREGVPTVAKQGL